MKLEMKTYIKNRRIKKLKNKVQNIASNNSVYDVRVKNDLCKSLCLPCKKFRRKLQLYSTTTESINNFQLLKSTTIKPADSLTHQDSEY